MEGSEGSGSVNTGEGVSGEDLTIGSAAGGLVTARGTGDGFVLRIDGRVAATTMRNAVQDFLEGRKDFLEGNDISLEWVGGKPEESVVVELAAYLSDKYGVRVKSSRVRSAGRGAGSSGSEIPVTEEVLEVPARVRSGLPVERVLSDEKPVSSSPIRRMSLVEGGVDSSATSDSSLFGGVRGDKTKSDTGKSRRSDTWDDADARMVYGTVRSGQKIESEHTVVVCGDVNSGAEIIAGGDIVVLGTLRGIAHAGAYEESGGGRFIMAHGLQPTQLRIGSVISRGVSGGRGEARVNPEIARVDGAAIVVEAFQPRQVLHSR